MKFDIFSGAIWRRRGKFEQGCTTSGHPYKKPLKQCLKLVQLNSNLVSKNDDTIFRFWHYRYKLTVFVAPVTR